MSFAFDDASQTIRVTGKPLRFGDRHFPAPTEMTIGRAPRDLILTRRTESVQDDVPGPDDVPGLDEVVKCMKDPKKCLMSHLPTNISVEASDNHIDFNSGEKEPRKKYWPPE